MILPPPGSETERLIDEFLEGSPRADTWASLRKTLEERLVDARQQLQATSESQRSSLTKRIKELEQQVIALREEEEITRFVEESVRATVARPHPLEINDDD